MTERDARKATYRQARAELRRLLSEAEVAYKAADWKACGVKARAAARAAVKTRRAEEELIP